jgi:ABC-type lipoprotein release transport system permease subunit
MTTAVASIEQTSRSTMVGLTWVLAWRNLWRNPRRTWLTAGGIAFASMLVTMAMAMQAGSYGAIIGTATSFYLGQAQINHKDYEQEEKLEQTVPGATVLIRELRRGGIRVAPRAQAFALASVGERSFGAAVVGVDFAAEQRVVSFFERVESGALPVADDEVLVGETMARNLGAGIGDELVLLGTAKEGGIGALSLRISGLYRSGRIELDRLLVFTHLPTVQNAFALGDEVHALVLRFDHLETAAEDISDLQPLLPESSIIRSWQELMPEVVQGIELDRVGGLLFYGAILILVTFSVVNTFIMIVFERTREFGMLLALGTKPGIIMRQVQAEALMMWGVGVAIGLIVSNVVVGLAAAYGIPLGDMEEMGQQFYMPTRLYPAISVASLALAPLVLLVGTQLAAALVTLRIRRLRPVAALRVE